MVEAVAKEKKPRTRRNFEQILSNLTVYCESQVNALETVKTHLAKANISTEPFDNQLAAYEDILKRAQFLSGLKK